MPLHAYPTLFPSAEVWQLAADALRGTIPDPKEAAHAVWHLVGLGLGQWDVHPQPMMATPLSADGAAMLCESMAATRGATYAAGAFPWAALLPVLMDLGTKLLERLLRR